MLSGRGLGEEGWGGEQSSLTGPSVLLATHFNSKTQTDLLHAHLSLGQVEH